MVYFMENPIKMDDLGGKTRLFSLFLVQHGDGQVVDFGIAHILDPDNASLGVGHGGGKVHRF